MRHILANLFISEVFIPEAGLLTVTKVTVTDDLKIAKVYLSFLENKKPVEDILEILGSKHNLIRHHMGLKLTMKYIPQLQDWYASLKCKNTSMLICTPTSKYGTSV